eukprot:TRINITY_DN2802_c1_g1_i12.p1 TRINITY_DN2802_c1_g1~~TRINITY_DN2802_c1_g1_i12.p1  ORF type:complete len:253 (+),score=60.74 TRINITY_DN2802_c1_g1_i12:692-1450(+)
MKQLILVLIKHHFFEFGDYVIELRYLANSSMYFKVLGLDFDGGLRRIESDKDVVALLEHYKDSEVLIIYVERGHEPLMVVSPKGKILLQNIHSKGPLKQLPAAEVVSVSRKHCEEDYGADVEDETNDDPSKQNGHHDDSNVHHHPDIEDDHNQQHQLNDDSEVESEEQGFDPDEPPELHEDVEKPEDEDIEGLVRRKNNPMKLRVWKKSRKQTNRYQLMRIGLQMMRMGMIFTLYAAHLMKTTWLNGLSLMS